MSNNQLLCLFTFRLSTLCHDLLRDAGNVAANWPIKCQQKSLKQTMKPVIETNISAYTMVEDKKCNFLRSDINTNLR